MAVKASATRSLDGRSATIRWSRQSDLTGYEIYRRIVGGPWVRIHTRPATAISYVAQGLDPVRDYEFFVRGQEQSPTLFTAGINPDPEYPEWYMGVILVPRTVFTKPNGQKVDVQWDSAAYDNAKRLVNLFPSVVEDWSDGMCPINLIINENAGPLTTLSPYGTGWWPARNDTQQWWQPGVDAIFVLWDTDDDVTDEPGLTQHLGLGMGGKPIYGTWGFPDGDEWWWAKTPEAMVHEFMHGVISTFAGRGFPMPDLHSADAYGYPKDPITNSYEKWLRKVMTGTLVRPDDGALIGCTPAAWKSGPPR